MLKVALPTGDLRSPTVELLQQAGLSVREYEEGSRTYRYVYESDTPIVFRVFRERDIPIQIALGNYDAGICSTVWADELLYRYPAEALMTAADLGYGYLGLYAAVAPKSPAASDLAALSTVPILRVVSEFPNLAEAFALSARLPRYRVYQVWGAAEAYPPEDADLAVVATPDADAVRRMGLEPVHQIAASTACLVVNRRSLQTKDMSALLGPLLAAARTDSPGPRLTLPGPLARRTIAVSTAEQPAGDEIVRLALPDGHQQPHAMAALAAAGIEVFGYGAAGSGRRLETSLPYLKVKTIRPQDMPQQVALGHFDLAITGRDWLLDHQYRFPSSPVREMVDLDRARYKLAVVVEEELAATTVEEALAIWRRDGRQVIRIASEYVNIADHFARQHHLGRYQVIPITGASEAFVPEDADILIEGTETGRTLAANRLKILDVIFESTSCLIASKRPLSGRKATLVNEVAERLRQGVAATGSLVPSAREG